MTRERFVAETVAWLNARVVKHDTSVGAATRLFDDGIIDSIAILKLIAWTERATGERIADARIRMDNFATVERIAEVFIEEQH